MKPLKSALWYLCPTPLYTWSRPHRRESGHAVVSCNSAKAASMPLAACVDDDGWMKQLYIGSSVGRGRASKARISILCFREPNWVAKYSNLCAGGISPDDGFSCWNPSTGNAHSQDPTYRQRLSVHP
jgi:hypothetical protein